MTAGAKSLIAYRRVLIVLVHLLLWSGVLVLSFGLRFEFKVPPFYVQILWRALPIFLVFRTIASFYFGVFRGIWRYAGTRDLLALIKATTVSTVLFILAVHFLGPSGFPRSVFAVEWLASIVFIGGMRLSIRTVREIAAQTSTATGQGERRKVIIAGAGDEGEALVRELLRSQRQRYEPVGFVDDSVAKQREHIHDVPVLGTIADLPDLVKRHEAAEVIIAMASASGSVIRGIVASCSKTGAQVRTIPGYSKVIDGRVKVSELRRVAIEDLLRREPVTLDTALMSEYLRGKVVLVTGAGGSIGSELCRQVGKHGPAKLILVEQAENNLFHVHRELRAQFPEVAIVPCIADICDRARLDQIFGAHKPSVVFHAAAHKHVPMMEWNPGEAIKNNIFGSKSLADVSQEHGVQRFVMISTDKAVNPTSVMGASKRAAEIYIQALSRRSSTRFVTVRFGNVLGSAGSVIPLFEEQIQKGGPVTVTHPDMMRYFMTIPEACQLVLQAGAMGSGGEIFILDMGAPVKIVDLARDLIELSGLTVGEDIEIEFTGMRPGEKLFEELAVHGEHVDKTRHPKIFVGKLEPYAWADVTRHLGLLSEVAESGTGSEIRAELAEMIPEYRPAEDSHRASKEPSPPAPVERAKTAEPVIH